MHMHTDWMNIFITHTAFCLPTATKLKQATTNRRLHGGRRESFMVHGGALTGSGRSALSDGWQGKAWSSDQWGLTHSTSAITRHGFSPFRSETLWRCPRESSQALTFPKEGL